MYITGTTRQTINSYIHGRHQMRLEAIVLIASALHVSMDYLLGLSDKEETDSQQYFNVWAFSIKGDCLPSVKTFYAIVKVLNVSADTLLTSKNEGGAAA